MRLDHVSYVTSHDQLADTVQRLGSRLGSTFVDGGIHPRFGTRNFTAALKNGQYIRLDFPKTNIDPLRYRSPSGELIADRYTCESHPLQNNQMVTFIDQESSSNGIEEGQVYLVQVENENDFFLRKVNLISEMDSLRIIRRRLRTKVTYTSVLV
mgnify:CR=1 FL=1